MLMCVGRFTKYIDVLKCFFVSQRMSNEQNFSTSNNNGTFVVIKKNMVLMYSKYLFLDRKLEMYTHTL